MSTTAEYWSVTKYINNFPVLVGYLLLISWDVDDPGEAWRSLWTFCWTHRLLTINSILRSTTAIKSLSCKLILCEVYVPACLERGSSSNRSTSRSTGESHNGRLAITFPVAPGVVVAVVSFASVEISLCFLPTHSWDKKRKTCHIEVATQQRKL